MFGHSFGAATTVLSSQLDTRIDVSAGLDGWFAPLSNNHLNNGLKIPFLHIGRKSWGLFSDNYQKMEKLMNNSKVKQVHYPVRRMQHFDFMDGSQSASLAIKFLLKLTSLLTFKLSLISKYPFTFKFLFINTVSLFISSLIE